jgi:hypothetical protein
MEEESNEADASCFPKAELEKDMREPSDLADCPVSEPTGDLP